MDKKKNIKKLFPMISLGLGIIGIILTIVLYSVRLLNTFGGKNVWASANIVYSSSIYPVICLILVIMFVINAIMLITAGILLGLKKKSGMWTQSIYGLIFSLTVLIFQGISGIFRTVSIIFIIINIIVAIGSLIFMILGRQKSEETEEVEYEQENSRKSGKLPLLIINIVSIIATLSVFFIPLYFKTINNVVSYYMLISSLTATTSDIYLYTLFMVFFVIVLFGILYFINSLTFYSNSSKEFITRSKHVMYINTLITFIFFIVGYFSCFSIQTMQVSASTISYIPLIILICLLIIFSVFWGKSVCNEKKDKKTNTKEKGVIKLEALIFCFALTAIVIISNFFNVIDISFKFGGFTNEQTITGFDLLFNHAKYGEGFRGLAFFIFVELIVSLTLLLVTLVAYLTKYKKYNNVIKLTAISNLLLLFLIGMFGLYYQIVQALNEETIYTLLEYFELPTNINYDYTIKSQTLYAFIVALVVFFVMMSRRHLDFEGDKDEVPYENNPVVNPIPEIKEVEKPLIEEKNEEPKKEESKDFDSCPAFTELDSKKMDYYHDLLSRQYSMFNNASLPSIVKFVVDYARDSRLHLSYSTEDVATFVAGLGTSRLSILQGMSGTGKTSLPKIFIEALMGNCEIIEVESSWRDKNELIGYYNEFSKCFTPKKFTQCLYKAKLNPAILTFLVLDEMNLSRIEYYFSDFLSLMENEEDKREIKLLNVKLARTENNEKISYLGLENGHTMRIPNNVWFIGTANRDESTFDISDKVYDRAQTMNFNKRAPKITSTNEPLEPKFLSYLQISELFKTAKENVEFDAETCELISGCEKLLQPYNISFGNRVLNQIEDFVKLYVSCFDNQDGKIEEAVERILLSKVVAKLETKNVENKDELATSFDDLSLHKCAEFIRKLDED